MSKSRIAPTGPASAGHGIVGAVSMIAIVTLAARFFGFLRWFAQSTWVGAGEVGNAYASANQIPNVVFEVAAGGALAGVTIPLLAAPIARQLRGEVNRTASALLTWTLLILIPVAALVWIFAEPIVSLLPVTRGSDVLSQEIMVAAFLRIFAAQIPLYGISIVLTGVLQAHKKFFWPALAPLLSSLVVIGTYAVYGALSAGHDSPYKVADHALAVLGWGTTAGVAAMSLPLFFPVLRLGVKLYPCLSMDRTSVKRALMLGGAGVGALLAQQVTVITNLFLVRWGGEVGSINVFQYAQAVYVLPYAVLAVPIATAVFPHLTELRARADMDGFARICAQATRTVMTVSFIGTGALIALGPAAEAIFSWRKPAEGMAVALLWLAPSLLGYALLFHLSRVLYSLDAGPAAVTGAAIGWLGSAGASIVAVALLSPNGGDGPATLKGMAMGQSIGMTACAAFLMLAVKVKAGSEAFVGVGRTLGVMIPAAALSGFLGLHGYNYLLEAFSAGLGATIGAAIAAGLIVLGICAAAIAAGLRGMLSFKSAVTARASVAPAPQPKEEEHA